MGGRPRQSTRILHLTHPPTHQVVEEEEKMAMEIEIEMEMTERVRVQSQRQSTGSSLCGDLRGCEEDKKSPEAVAVVLVHQTRRRRQVLGPRRSHVFLPHVRHLPSSKPTTLERTVAVRGGKACMGGR